MITWIVISIVVAISVVFVAAHVMAHEERLANSSGRAGEVLSARLLSVACYVGLAPLVNLWRSQSSKAVVRHHYAQAMAAFFVLLLLFVAVLLLDITQWITLVYVPHFNAYGWEMYGRYAMWLLVAGLGISWLALLLLAVAGSTHQIVLLRRLTRKTWITRFAFVANSFLLALIPMIAVLTWHAASLTRTSRARAAVHFLYDEGIPVPRWTYALWMYRVSLQAQHNWGKDQTVLDRLNKETLRVALSHGKVVILATHGGDGYACTWYAPEKLGIFPPTAGAINETHSPRFLHTRVYGADHKWGRIESMDVNRDVRLVYIFGCDSGKKASLWQEHLAPARVVAYSRWSTVFDHALWFAFTGPAELKRLQLKAYPNE